MKKTLARALCAIITFLFAITLIIPCLALAYLDFTNNIPDVSPSFMITAHTGCENTEDNSLESIIKGIKSGANCVEFDIRFLADGTPVLGHDQKDINDQSVKLESAFNLLYLYNVKINLDLKEFDYVENIANLVSFYDLENRCFFTGVTENDVAKITASAPDIAYYLNTKIPTSKRNDTFYILDIGEKAKTLGAIGVNLKHTNITAKCVDLWHSQDLLVSVYTVNSRLDINSALNKNVDNITTLKPSLAVYLKNKV
jgi:glycerophosphoryl diester phosphodiesterase